MRAWRQCCWSNSWATDSLGPKPYVSSYNSSYNYTCVLNITIYVSSYSYNRVLVILRVCADRWWGVQALLQRGWPGQLRYVRRNLYTAIYILDPALLDHLQLISDALNQARDTSTSYSRPTPSSYCLFKSMCLLK